MVIIIIAVILGELMTIGIDGFIRVWDFETIDTADVTEEADLFEMDPMNELRVGNNVQLKSIVKSVDPEEHTVWYAQVCRLQVVSGFMFEIRIGNNPLYSKKPRFE